MQSNLTIPRFLPSPDRDNNELFITCTEPLALIWVQQTTPAKLWIIKGPEDTQLLQDAGDWWRQYGIKNKGGS